MSPQNYPVVLFDGVCNLCNNAVQFIIRHDSTNRLRFTSLQSEAGRKLLLTHSRTDLLALTSIVFVRNGQIYTESTAVLRIMRCLQMPWPLLSVLRFIPRPLRDYGYKLIATNRYRWFGKQDACWLPTPSLKARFLIDSLDS